MAEEQKAPQQEEGEPKKKQEEECEECVCTPGLPEWLATFGDLMSLLLCFFVLLLSMATFDGKPLSTVQGSLTGALNILNGGVRTQKGDRRVQEPAEMVVTEDTADEVKLIKSSIINFSEHQKNVKGPKTTLYTNREGYMIRLPATLFFKEGQTELKDANSILFIKRMAEIISMFPKNLQIKVTGHTDSTKPNGRYKDNWTLSTHMALSVAKLFKDTGISDKKILVSGDAEFSPVAPNNSKEGRDKNRRVEIVFYQGKTIIEGRKDIFDRKIEQREFDIQ